MFERIYPAFFISALLAGAAIACAGPVAAADDDVNALQEQISVLQKRIEQLEEELSEKQVASPHPWQAPLHDEWNPFQEMERMRRRINRMFQDSFGRAGSRMFEHFGGFDVDIDMRENEKEYLYMMDVPGMDKEGIDIEVRSGMLIVSGERMQERANNSNQFSLQERTFGSFSRSVALPPDARTDQITAEYEKGVLTVRIPKDLREKKESQSNKRIPII